MKYIASKHYMIVCEETCFHVKNIKESNRLEYETLNDSYKDGCRGCKHCVSKGKGK